MLFADDYVRVHTPTGRQNEFSSTGPTILLENNERDALGKNNGHVGFNA